MLSCYSGRCTLYFIRTPWCPKYPSHHLHLGHLAFLWDHYLLTVGLYPLLGIDCVTEFPHSLPLNSSVHTSVLFVQYWKVDHQHPDSESWYFSLMNFVLCNVCILYVCGSVGCGVNRYVGALYIVNNVKIRCIQLYWPTSVVQWARWTSQRLVVRVQVTFWNLSNSKFGVEILIFLSFFILKVPYLLFFNIIIIIKRFVHVYFKVQSSTM